MQRRKILLTALLAVCVAVTLLFSSQLPALVFRYLDASAQQRTTFEEPESLSLTLEEDSGLSIIEKLKVCTEYDYQEIEMEERSMVHTQTQAQELAGIYLSVLQDALGMETWQLDYQSVSASGWVYWSQQQGERFRVWRIAWESEGGRTASVTMDDETGVLLTISCDNASGETDAEGMAEEAIDLSEDYMLQWMADTYTAQLWEQLGETAEPYTGIDYGELYQEGEKLFLTVSLWDSAESGQETADDASPEEAEAAGEDVCTLTIWASSTGWGVN